MLNWPDIMKACERSEPRKQKSTFISRHLHTGLAHPSVLSTGPLHFLLIYLEKIFPHLHLKRSKAAIFYHTLLLLLTLPVTDSVGFSISLLWDQIQARTMASGR